MVRTANVYLELTNIHHALELLRKERDSAQKITDLTRDRVSAGYELPIEQTKAELSAARIEQRIAHNEGREDALESELRDMLGLQTDQPLELVAEDLPPAAERPVSELVAQALQSSAELRHAETERLAKQEILRGARGNRWPTVDLVGNYSVLSDTNNFSAFFKKFQRNNVNVGVQVTIPIFAAQTNATISLAQEDANAAAVEARNKRSQVELQVRSQAHMVRELELARDVARLDLKLAQENLLVLQAQFDQGRVTRQELERAHLEENDKWLAFLDADLQRQQASLALLQATGQVSTILR
jgi:outer membrane protein TolC